MNAGGSSYHLQYVFILWYNKQLQRRVTEHKMAATFCAQLLTAMTTTHILIAKCTHNSQLHYTMTA